MKMEDKKDVDIKTTFIAFLDDDGEKQEDWVDLIEENNSFVKFKYQGKELTIPWHRVLKVKKEVAE